MRNRVFGVLPQPGFPLSTNEGLAVPDISGK
jgi:hypothetical protein